MRRQFSKNLSSRSASQGRAAGTVARQSAQRQFRASTTRGLMAMRASVNKETGFVDLAAANYVCDTTGSVTLLATVAQGAGVSQRVGKKIVLKSLQCRGRFFAGTAGVINDCAAIIVYDKRPTGALPAVTAVLNTANAGSMNNDDNSDRFVILKRLDQILIGDSTTVSTGLEAVDVSFYLPLRMLPTVYKSVADGAIADIEQGALYLVTVGVNAAGATAASLNATFRTRFVDV